MGTNEINDAADREKMATFQAKAKACENEGNPIRPVRMRCYLFNHRAIMGEWIKTWPQFDYVALRGINEQGTDSIVFICDNNFNTVKFRSFEFSSVFPVGQISSRIYDEACTRVR